MNPNKKAKESTDSLLNTLLPVGFVTLCVGLGLFFQEQHKSNPKIIKYYYVDEEGGGGTPFQNTGRQTGGTTEVDEAGNPIDTGESNVPPGTGWTDDYHAHAMAMAEKYGLTKLSPADKARYFPGVEGNPTAEDWANFIGRMAYYESGYRPDLTYKENFNNQYGQQVISTGLTQISYASAAGYKDANGNQFNLTTEDLKNPYTNIEVTASILATQVGRAGVISGGGPGNWSGAASYWSIFRTGKM